MKNKLMWIIMAVSVIAAAAVVGFLPDIIPMHFDITGAADRYGSKYEIFIFLGVNIIFLVINFIADKVYKKQPSAFSDEKKIAEIKNNMKIMPVITIVGMLVFLLIGGCPELYGDYACGGGLLAGVFEEGGRFISYKLFLKNINQKKTAVSYGIGHGGIESVYVGYTALMFAVMGIIINDGGIDTIIGSLDEITKATALAQLESYAAYPLYMPAVFGTPERISVMIFHTSMSVLVFAAAREKKIHFPLSACNNSMVGFVNSGMIFAIGLEFMMLAYAIATAFIAFRLYKKLDGAGNTQISL